MSDREPARDTYDAVVDLAIDSVGGPSVVALVKQTYEVTDRGVSLAAPEPLFHDMRDPEVEPLLKEGTDFWVTKLATDFVVQGSAFSRGGTPTPQMSVSVRAGTMSKNAVVHGRRLVVFKGTTPRFELVEPAAEVPLTWNNAYGGCDFRAVDPSTEVVTQAILADVDHPGLYPRNPFGKGYLVEPAPIEGMELPQVEDPSDLLTPERIIVRDPRRWWRQPLPWGFEFVHAMMWPRTVFFADSIDAWFPGPEDRQMPEVARGYLAAGYRTSMATRKAKRPTDVWFHQEGSHGLVLHDVAPGLPVLISGMHPEGRPMKFQLPPAPRIELQVENRRESVTPRLHTICCRPGEMKFNVVYGAALPLSRTFLPGIHKHIPAAAFVERDRPLVYTAVQPIRDRLLAAAEDAGG